MADPLGESGSRHLDPWSVWIPASRGRALSRAILWAAPTVILGGAAVIIFRGLDFSPAAAHQRLIQISIAVASAPLAIAALTCGFACIRYSLLALWPGRVGMEANNSTLAFRLGPFGTRRYDSASLDIRYPFEQSGDVTEGGFEAFLPEDEQLARLVPRITHPRAKEPLNRVLVRFCSSDEAELAQTLRPAIDRWRGESHQV